MNELTNFIRDLVHECRERAIEARTARAANPDEKQRSFQSGRNMAFIEVLSIIQQDLHALGISPKDVLLDIDPDRDLF
jgi:hypothetical protein